MKTYIINLLSSAARRAHMHAQMTAAGITDYEFIEAIDGTKTSPPNTAAACMASHRKAWQKISQSHTIEPVLILEDDVVLHESFTEHLSKKIYPDAYAHIGMLGYQIKGEPNWVQIKEGWRAPQNGTKIDFNGAYGYIVSNFSVAGVLLSHSKGIKYHPDLMIREIANAGLLCVYFANHPLIQHGGFKSTIDHSRVPQTVNLKDTTDYIPGKITLLHPSRGRAVQAQKTYDYWLKRATGNIDIEHIIVIDKDDAEGALYSRLFPAPASKVVINFSASCVVEATNRGALASTGDILVYLSDDFLCPKNWDLFLVEKFKNTRYKPMLLQVPDGINAPGTACLTIPIMNRALYNRLTYFWHPAYRSMFVDNDLYHTCQNNNWLVRDDSQVFTHLHPAAGTAPADETYKRSNANWVQGKQTFENRQKQGFPVQI